MSKDIRLYFAKKGTKKADDDDDVIPESPNAQTLNKKKPARKRRLIKEDSDEEITTAKKKPVQSALKEVKVVDVFGTGRIERSDPIVKKKKKESETGIHSDEEFEKSLLLIDEIDNLVTNETLKNENHVDKSFIKEDNKSEDKNVHNLKIKGHKKNDNSNTFQKTPKASKKRKADTKDNEELIDESKCKQITTGKTNFNEFIEDEINPIDESKSYEPKQKKYKLDKSLNDSVLSDEERHERKRFSAALYQKFLNRTGPKHLGTKEIPEGLPDCLKEYAFLLTGVLDSFEKDDIVAAITKYGGIVKSGISKKVTHVLAGDDAGPSKLAKAQELGIKIINEDEFLQIIKDSIERKSSLKDVKKGNNIERTSDKKLKENTHESKTKMNRKANQNESNKMNSDKKLSVSGIKQEKSISPKNTVHIEEKSEIIPEPVTNDDLQKSSDSMGNNSLMWVDKYKPQSVKQIIGQHGDKSNVKKLSNWLTQWYVSRKAKIPKPSPWAKDDNGAYFKAALLSGPPGVGKTTTVSLVCKELGFDMVEFNASDTRSKTLIREQIGELLTSTSLSAYARGATGKGAVSKKHVLVMDEVDGMAGNEDRGGLQELISLIKSASVPIICMCNDRTSEKMRSLLNYCYDLRFERPRVNQIMCAMLSICFKEGVKVPNDVLTQLIEAAGHDVRQTLHMLSIWVADSNLSDPERLKKEASKVKKDVKMGPWEAIRRVFSAEEHKKMTINDKSDLFFTDYSIMPLFVQENYLNVVPHGPGKASITKLETLERICRAADSISLGDLVDARIRGNQAWSLLPMQAMYSSVIPGQFLEGHIAGQIQFPGWLGKNSRANKMRRLCQEIHAHTRLSTSGSKSSIFLDYAVHIRDAIVDPLIQDKTNGIDNSLAVLESYHLLREDLESLIELSLWPEKRNPIVLVDPKVKAAMTRTYNKKASVLPYAPGVVKKGRGQDDSENSQEDCEIIVEDSDPENDAMVKKKKNKDLEKAGSSKTSTKRKKNEPSSPSKPKAGKDKAKTKINNKR